MSGLETQTCVERSYQVGTSPLPYQFLVDDDEKQDQTSPVCSGSGPDRAEDSCQAGAACTQRLQKAEGLQLVASFSFNSFFLKLEIAEGFQKQIVLVPHEEETIRKDVGILKL